MEVVSRKVSEESEGINLVEVVARHLLESGCRDAFMAFAESAGLDLETFGHEELRLLAVRKRALCLILVGIGGPDGCAGIRDCILERNVIEAVELLRQHFAGVLMASEELAFALDKQVLSST